MQFGWGRPGEADKMVSGQHGRIIIKQAIATKEKSNNTWSWQDTAAAPT